MGAASPHVGAAAPSSGLTSAARWFSADELATSASQHRALGRVATLRLVAELAVPLAFLAFGLAERLVRPYPPALWADRAVVVFAALEAAALPHRVLLGARSELLTARLGTPALSARSAGSALVGPVTAVVCRLVLGGLLVLAVSATARATPWWPLLLTAVVAGGSFAWATLYPYVVAPLVDRAAPVHDPGVVTRVEALAARAGLERPTVMAAVGEGAVDEGAYVAGFGRARRLVVGADLVQGPPDELDAVVAHELGHWKLGHHGHAVAALGAAAAATLGLLWAGDRAVRALAHAPGASDAPLDARLLPLWSLLLMVGSGATGLGLRALSRAQERQADAFACRLLGDGRPLGEHLRRLVVRTGGDLAPSRWRRLARSHPPPAQRLASLGAPTAGPSRPGGRGGPDG